MAATQTYQTGAIAISGSLAGTETVVVGNGGATITTVTTQQIANLASLANSSRSITALNTVGAGTITAAGIVGGITSRGGGQTATAFSDTTDTAAAIIAALPSLLPTGSSFVYTYENNTNAPATLIGGATVTLTGNTVVPALTWADYLITKTSLTAVSMAFVKGGSMVPLPPAQFVTGANTANATINVGGLTGAQICTLTLGGSVEGTYALPPALQITAAIPNAAPGLNYTLIIRNTGAAITATLSGLAGTTISGTATIARSSQRTFNVSVDSLGSVTLSGISTSSL